MNHPSVGTLLTQRTAIDMVYIEHVSLFMKYFATGDYMIVHFKKRGRKNETILEDGYYLFDALINESLCLCLGRDRVLTGGYKKHMRTIKTSDIRFVYLEKGTEERIRTRLKADLSRAVTSPAATQGTQTRQRSATFAR
jgi:hypothetical protein